MTRDFREGEKMPTLSIADEQLHYIDKGQGRPVLLVHGFPLDCALWDEQLVGLADLGRLIAPDLRGFGASRSARTANLSIEQFADDLAHLLDALRISEPVVFCGLSMGGYIAFEFVRKYADRLRGLVLCDTRAAADTPETKAARRTMASRVIEQGPQFVIEAMLPRMFSPRTPAERPGAVDRWKEMVRRCPPETIAAASLAMGERRDSTELLPAIRCPTLFVVGADDVTSPPEEMRAMAAAVPKSRFAVIPDAGHLTPIENPAGFNAVLGDWLNGLD